MINNGDIKKIFNSLFGVDVDIKTPKIPKQSVAPVIDYPKNYFMRSISEWRNAALIQATLLETYGINLHGYDKQLFDAIESMVYSLFGPVRGSIIISFIYCPLNLEVESFRVVDKTNKQYLLSNSEDLYNLIINCKDEDFLNEE